MRKLMQISENNLVGIIKNMLLEQSAEEIASQYGRDVNLNMLPTQGVPAVQPAAAQQQPAAAQQQPAAAVQQPAQQSANYCPYGYQKVTQGPYFICSESENIKNLQKSLGIPPDGKFGINTLRAVYKKFGKISVSDDEINTFIKQSTPDAVGTTNAQTQQPASKSTFVNKYNPAGPLTTLNGKVIKISNNALEVLSIYARYDRIWAGEFTIYINTALPGSFGSKKYTYATKCSLLAKNELQIPKINNTYKFNDPNSAIIISNHFCVAKK